MITYYAILKHENPVHMVDHVNAALREGWQPHGGIAIAPSDSLDRSSPLIFVQAMVRTDAFAIKERPPISSISDPYPHHPSNSG